MLMKLVKEYKELTHHGKLDDIKTAIKNRGWDIKEKKLDENILSKADIYNYEIILNSNSQYKEYSLLHQLYHITEGKINNLNINGELEVADYFASLILLDTIKIPSEKLDKF